MTATHAPRITRGARALLGAASAALVLALGASQAGAQVGSSGFSGALPGGDGVALLTTTTASNPETLSELLADAGCDLESIAALDDGTWLV